MKERLAAPAYQSLRKSVNRDKLVKHRLSPPSLTFRALEFVPWNEPGEIRSLVFA
jgi:hypothetical protein